MSPSHLTLLRKQAREHLRASVLHTRIGRFEAARREAELAVLVIERCINLAQTKGDSLP